MEYVEHGVTSKRNGESNKTKNYACKVDEERTANDEVVETECDHYTSSNEATDTMIKTCDKAHKIRRLQTKSRYQSVQHGHVNDEMVKQLRFEINFDAQQQQQQYKEARSLFMSSRIEAISDDITQSKFYQSQGNASSSSSSSTMQANFKSTRKRKL